MFPRRVRIAAVVVAVLFVTGLASGPVGFGAPWVVEVFAAGAWTWFILIGALLLVITAQVVLAGPVAWLIAAVVAVLFFGSAAGRLYRVWPRRVVKDPQRLFSGTQKREGNELAGHRCEMESWWFVRCQGPAEHGDHWWPHSKGGATTMQNYVAACARCNGRKSDRIPSRFATMRLERRRRTYFPVGVPVTAGERTTDAHRYLAPTPR